MQVTIIEKSRDILLSSNLELGESSGLVFIALLSQNRAEHGGFPPSPLIIQMCLNLDVCTLAEALELSALYFLPLSAYMSSNG